jgi:hypothetical protein
MGSRRGLTSRSDRLLFATPFLAGYFDIFMVNMIGRGVRLGRSKIPRVSEPSRGLFRIERHQRG